MENRLLSAMRPDCLDWLRSHLTTVTLVNRQTLYERDTAIEHVFFLDSGMVSIIVENEDFSHGIEIGLVGREGLVGIAALLEDRPIAFHRSMVQMPGSARRMTVAAFQEGIGLFPDFRRLCLRYVLASMAEVSMIAVCNSGHAMIERCARWILMARDRADSLEVPLTQAFLAAMLGARRPAVTAAAGALRRAGFIRYSRGHIHILDRDGLEGASCGCYRRIMGEFIRLLPP